jgi:hypothetical protein
VNAVPISDEQKRTYAGIYILKKLDLKPAEGGLQIPVILDAALYPIEPVLEHLVMQGLLQIDRKAQRYTLTRAGIAHIGGLIDEAEGLIDEFDDWDTADMVAELQARNLDPLRARFLWGWYQGEFDDLVLFQQRRGVEPVEYDWAQVIMGDALYDNLLLDLELDDEEAHDDN